MKIKIEVDKTYDNLEIIIKTNEINDDVQKIYDLIESQIGQLIVKRNGQSFSIAMNDIYYIESIDDKTFIYLKESVFEINKRLYELEQELNLNFIRVSKSTILNINKLNYVKAILNGKYEAYLDNDEKIIISRHYVRQFKKKFGIGG